MCSEKKYTPLLLSVWRAFCCGGGGFHSLHTKTITYKDKPILIRFFSTKKRSPQFAGDCEV